MLHRKLTGAGVHEPNRLRHSRVAAVPQRALRQRGRKPVYTAMAIKKLPVKEWQKLVAESERRHAELAGDSPGGVARQLGCSRQFVHSLIRRGLLDAVALYEGRELVAYMIPQPSVDAYLRTRRAALKEQLRKLPA